MVAQRATPVYIPHMSAETKTVRIGMFMAPSEVEAIDEWRRRQPDLPSRSEAIRRLVKIAIKDEAPA